MGKYGDWKKLNKVLDTLADERKLAGHLEDATKANAIDAQKEIVTAITSQRWTDWPPLAESTVESKLRQGRHKSAGGIKILIDTSQLVQNITHHVFNALNAGVGVMKGVYRKDGESMVNIARVHEFGSQDGRIPARPFLGRGARLAAARCVNRWAKAVQRIWR